VREKKREAEIARKAKLAAKKKKKKRGSAYGSASKTMSAKKSTSLTDTLKKQPTMASSASKKSNASPDKPPAGDTMNSAKNSANATVTIEEAVVNIDFAKAAEDVKENEVTLGGDQPPIGSDSGGGSDRGGGAGSDRDPEEKDESVMNSTMEQTAEIGAGLDETLPKATLDALGAIEEDEDGERDGQTSLEKT